MSSNVERFPNIVKIGTGTLTFEAVTGVNAFILNGGSLVVPNTVTLVPTTEVTGSVEIVKTEDTQAGTYTYTLVQYVASVTHGETTTSYTTLAGAIAAANTAAENTEEDSVVVTLLKPCDGTATLADKVVLVEADNAAFSGTLSGSGTIELAALRPAQTALATFTDWTGVVVLPADQTFDGHRFDDYGVEGSAVRLQGDNSGWLGYLPVGVIGNRAPAATTVDIPAGASLTVPGWSASFANAFNVLTGAGTFAVSVAADVPLNSTDYSAYFHLKDVSGFSGSLAVAEGSKAGIAVGASKPYRLSVATGGAIVLTSVDATLSATANPEPVTTVVGYYVKQVSGVYSLESYKTVRFVDEDGETVLQTTGNLKIGATVGYTSATPTKAATAQYTYTFTGWDDGTTQYGPTDALPAVTGDVTYTATYSSTVNEYTITWIVDETSDTTQVAYGTIPTYADPVKQYYTFTGWDPSPVAVDGAATYTATFSRNMVTVTIPSVTGAMLMSATSDGGTVTPTGANTLSVPAGSTLTLTWQAMGAYVLANTTTTANVGTKAVTLSGDAVASPAPAVAQDSDGTYYADVMTGLYWLLTPANLESGYLQLLGETTGDNVYGAYDIGYDAASKRYAKAVALIDLEGNYDPGYLTVQAALDAAENGALVRIKANNSETLTLANGKSVTINAKKGDVIYDYTAPVAAGDYTVDAGETVEGVTTYTARDWYSWTVTVEAENATVTGITSPVSESDPTITFTVTPDQYYSVSSVTANGTTLTPVNDEYNYTLTGDVTISATATRDQVTLTIPVVEHASAVVTVGGVQQEVADSYTINKGENVVVTWTAEATWKIAPADATQTINPITASQTATAPTVVRDTVTITVPAVTGATADVSAAGDVINNGDGTWTVQAGATVTVTYTAANGKYIAGTTGTTAQYQQTVNDNYDFTSVVTATTADTVAKIGDACYGSFEAAVAAATAGQTVTLVADSTVTSHVYANKAINIHGGNHSINIDQANLSSHAYNTFPLWIETTAGDEVEIKNVTINATGGNYALGVEQATTTLKNVTINANGCIGFCQQFGSATLENVTIANTGTHSQHTWMNTAVSLAEGATVTVKSGSFSSANGSALYLLTTGGTMNIQGGTYSGAIVSGSNAGRTATINITGGDFSNASFDAYGAGTSEIAVSGGTFDVAVPLECCKDGYIPQDNGNGTYGVEPGWVITFVNDDNTVLAEVPTAEGAEPSYTGETPTKAATAQYSYTFNGWTPAVVAVTGAATYTATYTETVNEYTITWKNDDGSTIDTTQVAYGTTPTHADATKTATAQYSYTFNGWTPEIAAVTADATYTATFTETLNNYTITLPAYDPTRIAPTVTVGGEEVVGEGGVYTVSAGSTVTVTWAAVGANVISGTTTETFGNVLADVAAASVTLPTVSEAVAQIGTTYYASLAAAVEAAQANDTVTLLADVAAERTTISKSLTLDLGGKTLTGRVTISDGTVTVQNGTIAGRFDTYDSATVTLAATATVNGRVVVWGDGTYGETGCKTPTLNINGTIVTTGEDDAIFTSSDDASHPVVNINAGSAVTAETMAVRMSAPGGVLTMNGGEIGSDKWGVFVTGGSTFTMNGGSIEFGEGGFGVGNHGNDTAANGTDTAITIAGGTISGPDTAVYHPGEGTLDITGGTITGTTGVEVRAGTFNIPSTSTAVITATGAFDESANGSGATVTGAAVAISQHTTNNPIAANIQGGTFNSTGDAGVAFYVTDTANADPTEVAATVSGGTFYAPVVVAESAADVGTIIPATSTARFSDATADGVAAGYELVLDEETNLYTIAALAPIKLLYTWTANSVYYFPDQDPVPSATTQATVPKYKREGASSYVAVTDGDGITVTWTVTTTAATTNVADGVTCASVDGSGLVTFTEPGSVKLWVQLTDAAGSFRVSSKTVKYAAAPAYVVSADGQTRTAYSSLYAAFNHAATGEKIVLCADASVSNIARMTLKDGRALTLDLNGHTVTCSVNFSGTGSIFNIQSGSLSVVDTGATKGGIAATGNGGRVFSMETAANATTALSIGEGVNISSAHEVCVYLQGNATLTTAGNLTAASDFAICGNGSAGNGGTTVNVTGGTVSGAEVAIYQPQNGALNISGGTITGGTAVYVKSGSVTVTGGTLNGTGALTAYTYNGSGANATGEALVIENCGYPGGVPTVSITGGTFTSANAYPVGSYTKDDSFDTVIEFISGGTFSDEVLLSYCANGYMPKDNGNGTYGVAEGTPVAQNFNTGVYYSTLASAVSEASAGDTITMLVDEIELTSTIEIDKTLTIDLGSSCDIIAKDCRAFLVKAGHFTLTGLGVIRLDQLVDENDDPLPMTLADSSSVIRVGSDTAETRFTLGDSVYVTSDYCYGITYFGAKKQTVVINGSVMVSGTQAALSGNGSASYNTAQGGSDVTVATTGYVTADYTYAIYSPETGTLTINGLVVGMGGIEVKAGTVVVGEAATITSYVENEEELAHATSNNGTSTTGYAIAAVGNANYVGAPTVTIEEGATIEGFTIALAEANAPAIGTVTAKSDALQIPEGYKWVETATGVYELVEKTYVAQVNGQGYETLQEALAAASSGDTVTLLANISATAQVVVSKAITLDGGNHTLTTTANWAINVHDVDNATVTIKDLTVTPGSATERFVNVEECANLTLNVTGCDMQGCTYYAVNVRGSNTGLALNIDDSTISGYCALNFWGDSGTVTVTDSTLVGVNNASYSPNNNEFGVIVCNKYNDNQPGYAISVSNTTLRAVSNIVTQGKRNDQYILLYNPNTKGNTIRLTDCTVEHGEGDAATYDFIYEETGTSGNTTYVKNVTLAGETVALPEGYAYSAPDADGYCQIIPAWVITWVVDGTSTTTNVANGETPVYPGETPTKEGYTFTGWNPSIVAATEAATYTAVFEEDQAPVTDGIKIDTIIDAEGELDPAVDTKIVICTEGGSPIDDPTSAAGSDYVANDVSVSVGDTKYFKVVQGANESAVYGVTSPNTTKKLNIVAVPFAAIGEDAGDVKIAKILDTGKLNHGDKVYVYSASGDTYNVWVLTVSGTEKSWEPVLMVKVDDATDTTETTPMVFADATVARGGAFWVEIAPGNDSQIVLIGQVASAPATKTVEAGTAAAPKFTLCASPKAGAFVLNREGAFTGPIAETDTNKVYEPGDTIQLTSDVGAPRVYYYNGTHWVYEQKSRVRNASPWKTDGEIPAGTGFWYISRGGAPTINW